MSASLSYLSTLPTEILEQFLLHLPGRDLIKMEAVNRRFQDLVRNSPALQHRRELFAIGLIDNPCYPCDLAERRKLYKGYASKWSDAANIVKLAHELPPNQSLGWDRAKYFGNGLLVSDSLEDNGLAFLRIPSVASQKPIDGWCIPPIPFRNSGYVVYPPGNVVAVTEREKSSIRIHFLNLRDGSPYCAPPSNVIVWEFPPGAEPIINDLIAITGSRVAMHISYYDEDLPGDALIRMILVWDWKTGELVLDLLSTGGRGLLGLNPQVVFLDEFRMALIPSELDITELAVFNTLIPQDHPGNLQRFGFPPEFRNWRARIFVDHDRDLGTPNRDEALIADPAQGVLVMDLLQFFGPHTLLVVRTQIFDQPYSVHGDSGVVPWAEWGRYVVALAPEVHLRELFTFVHGAQVVVAWAIYGDNWYQPGNPCYHVRTFNFGQGSPLPLRRGDNGTGWTALFEDGVSFTFESGIDTRGKDELRSLSNGSLFYLGIPGDEFGLNATLRVWELL